MNEWSRFESRATPRRTSLEAIGKEGLTTLFGGGIVNPFGPTLTAVTANGVFEEGRKLQVIHMVLNPFSQECTVIGDVVVCETWSPLKDLRQFFDLPFGSCPTLLLPSVHLNEDETVNFYSSFLSTFRDGPEVLEKVRRFPGDPWRRVQEDVDGLPRILDYGRPPGAQGATALDNFEARELAGLLLRPEYLRTELQAFMYAWNGSIEFQGPGSLMAERAFDLQQFINVFALLAASCRLPEITP